MQQVMHSAAAAAGRTDAIVVVVAVLDAQINRVSTLHGDV